MAKLIKLEEVMFNGHKVVMEQLKEDLFEFTFYECRYEKKLDLSVVQIYYKKTYIPLGTLLFRKGTDLSEFYNETSKILPKEFYLTENIHNLTYYIQ